MKDEKIIGMIALVVICGMSLFFLGTDASTVVGTAVGAIAGFITGKSS
jgi:outer membrane lipoprotein SlyB